MAIAALYNGFRKEPQLPDRVISTLVTSCLADVVDNVETHVGTAALGRPSKQARQARGRADKQGVTFRNRHLIGCYKEQS